MPQDRQPQCIEDGKGLPIEVLQSVQALAVARREYLRTLIDYNVAQFTLYRALGWSAASQQKLIDWQSGDEFEKARVQSQGAGH